MKQTNPVTIFFVDRSIWSHLGWRDIQSRYSRTLLGPWWSAANLSILVLGSSLAVGLLSNQGMFSQAPRIALGLSFWLLISNILIESVDLFESEKGILLNSSISEFTFIFRLVWRNFLVFLHSSLIVLAIFAFSQEYWSFRLLAIYPLAIIACIGTVYPAFIVSRVIFYLRDLKVLIPSFIQLAFFVTPILWVPHNSGPSEFVVAFNPVAWLIEFSRKLIIDASFDYLLVSKILIFCVASITALSLRANSTRAIRKWL